MSRGPVYWKPKYGTRSSRHRAWVKRQARRDARVARDDAPFLRRLWQRLRRALLS